VRVFENGVLRKVLGPTGDEVTGEWSRLHKEDIHGLYCSSSAMWVNTSYRKICPGQKQIPVAKKFEEIVCGLSFAKIEGSNPAGGLDVCPLWLLGVNR
jgi:hypothetical protein